MKKIPKSITVTVIADPYDKTTLMIVKKAGINLTGVNASGIIPLRPRIKPPYRVTYTLDKRGKYVAKLNLDTCIYRYPMQESDSFLFIACHLPHEWDGLRVSRKVEKIK